jgi:nucleoid-associated protein YgaU
MADQKRLDQLKQKYQSVFNAAQQQQVRLQNVHMEGEKLLIRGEAPSQDAKNKIWDQIKLVDPGYADLIADITVAEGRAQTAAAGSESAPSEGVYTVQPGDSLSKIARQYYGDANQYMRIFNANRDKLQDPNVIRPGQQLIIPAR